VASTPVSCARRIVHFPDRFRHQLRVDDDALRSVTATAAYRPRVIDGHADVEMAEVRTADFFPHLADSVSTLPCQSIQVSFLTPMVSMTSVSPDHCADE